MRYIGVILLLISMASINGQSRWSAGLYEKYNEQTFAAYAPALERIDMENIDFALLHAAVFYETNRIRKQHKLPMLRHSDALERAARAHSRDMVEYNFFSHLSPIKSKETLKERAAAVNIRNCRLAENIAELSGLDLLPNKPFYPPVQGQSWFSYEPMGKPIPNHTYLSLAKAVVKNWYESEGHRRNLLDKEMKFLGIGAAHFKDAAAYQMDRFRFTQLFSSADALCVSVQSCGEGK